MKEYSLPNSEELEMRAHRCRILAGRMHHPEIREDLLRIADEYDDMAQRVGREWLERRDRRRVV